MQMFLAMYAGHDAEVEFVEGDSAFTLASFTEEAMNQSPFDIIHIDGAYPRFGMVQTFSPNPNNLTPCKDHMIHFSHELVPLFGRRYPFLFTRSNFRNTCSLATKKSSLNHS